MSNSERKELIDTVLPLLQQAIRTRIETWEAEIDIENACDCEIEGLGEYIESLAVVTDIDNVDEEIDHAKVEQMLRLFDVLKETGKD
jgi:hypothetical protein